MSGNLSTLVPFQVWFLSKGDYSSLVYGIGFFPFLEGQAQAVIYRAIAPFFYFLVRVSRSLHST